MDSLRVSAIVPVYNGARYLREALASILRQSPAPMEVLVVDDGSTDSSAAVAEQFEGVRVIRQANRGPAAARNRGVAEARGEVIAFLDADDLWADDKLARQLPLIAMDGDRALVIGLTQRVHVVADAHGNPSLERLGPPVMLDLFGCALYRRTVFDKVGSFDEAMRVGEDEDWFMRIRESAVPTLADPHVSLLYRIHEGNMTRDRAAGRRGLIRLVRNRLARLRSAGSVPPDAR